MANTFGVSKVQMAFASCLLLAVLVGYLLAEPLELGNMVVVLLVLGTMAIPLLMKWYHGLLLVSWNAAINPFFLPGRPYLWMVMAFVGLFFGVLNRISSGEQRFVVVPSINRALLFLTIVTVVTALLRGGVGIRALGSTQYGGKGLFYIIAAIAGYFALASQRTPRKHAILWVSIFFLSGLTALIPNLIIFSGMRSDVLFYLFPPNYAIEQASADFQLSHEYVRVFGLTAASNALICYLLARFGLRGIFNWTKPWRLLLFGMAFAGTVFCGYRSVLILFGLIVVVQFYLEGLCRPRLLVPVAMAGVLLGAALLLCAARLPAVVQRTISFLPVEISPVVRQEAEATTKWRMLMWQEVLPMVPQYFFKGKGFSVDPTELSFADENMLRGYVNNYHSSLISGDYHNGPLSLLIPLGVWGGLAFLWFVVVAAKYLYHNARYGDPALRQVNVFLLACFVARLLLFLFFFGAFYYDLFIFTGLLGLSASLNGVEPSAVEEPELESLACKEGLT